MSGTSDEWGTLPSAPAGRILRPDVVYGTAGAGGRELRLHLYATEPGARRPGIMLFHGGGRQLHRRLDAGGVSNELEVLPGLGHGLPETHPDICTRATTRFLARHLVALSP